MSYKAPALLLTLGTLNFGLDCRWEIRNVQEVKKAGAAKDPSLCETAFHYEYKLQTYKKRLSHQNQDILEEKDYI
ncbi:MAG: hypothetical protein A2Z25_02560 [Planctomycetes bacterium RBG_16_55_9]|nr:MAG: hypothetical protein A2Z25_02560 [Planctomycetes bacterium RBG_16_55_9]